MKNICNTFCDERHYGSILPLVDFVLPMLPQK